MIHGFVGGLGHLFVILSFVSALFAAISYFIAAKTDDFTKKEFWLQNGRGFFYFHTFTVIGIVASLFWIIYNHYFEYHYAWSHSSKHLPTHYMISCFWEGQEGSFLLWLFWHSLLGVFVIFTSKKWEAEVMTIFAIVQTFLASMILGIVIPAINFKIGSSPFILLRDALDAPIFKMNPDFVPEDGTGLNPLLQNYWMVIHPPTLFLGFATTLVPFAYVIAGLWKKEFKSWIKPALPWAIFSAAVLGLGIIMGGYWAYETLNFGGYWNWDPVENAVYVPWLILVGAIHMMITFNNSSTALKASIILVITTFILILYSTFLTRSGILGNSSVHSFTDLGMSGQLLIYMLFFLLGAIVLAVVRWKEIPTMGSSVSTYSREFWVFMGATVICMMGFHVLHVTSFPVYNSIATLFGFDLNLAPPAEPIKAYSNIQIWFAMGIAILSGTGQFFWWKKMDKEALKKVITPPIIIALLVSAFIMLVSGISNSEFFRIQYLLLVLFSVYSIVSNTFILIKISKTKYSLSGGAVAHIGVAMMLIGVLASSGYSKVVSLNNTGLLISKEADTSFNNENLLLFINEPRTMAGYEIIYRGDFYETVENGYFVNVNDLESTINPRYKIAINDIIENDIVLFNKSDTIEIAPENTYYQVDYKNESGEVFQLFPRAQINEAMGGLLASPDIRRKLTKDLYTHVSSIPNPDEPSEWGDLKELEVEYGKNFFVNDYVAKIEKIEPLSEVEGVELGDGDVAIKAHIKVMGESKDYTVAPIFLIKDKMVGRIPEEIADLGLKINVLNIFPEKNTFLLGVNTTQKKWIVLKALEKPLINVLWMGTLVLMFGFSIAMYRRYSEFKNQK
ncbi:MAG: cytochrome c biogenesis protein CcsA [Cyclobacteriaceae bacterium]|nr:cytochrome c biogenesis protein CcsA [Cyclobacteriaceae bacterium]